MAKLLVLLLFTTAVFATNSKWANIAPVGDSLLNTDLPWLYKLLPERQGRITGGEAAVANQFPYQVGLLLEKDTGGIGFCGGSLISDQWVLTAAHCTDGILSAEVRLGAVNIFEVEADNQVIMTVDAENFRVHENWDRSKLQNDLALLKLPKPVTFSDQIKPIALARASDVSSTFEEQPVIASGWGKDSDNSTTISPVLRYVQATIMKYSTCRGFYFFSPPPESNICMDTLDGKSTCNGDSGGPLVAFEDDGTPILIGSTSYGLSLGCEKGWPVVFARITSYLSWINEKTGIPLR